MYILFLNVTVSATSLNEIYYTLERIYCQLKYQNIMPNSIIYCLRFMPSNVNEDSIVTYYATEGCSETVLRGYALTASLAGSCLFLLSGFWFFQTNYTKKANMIPFYFQYVNTSPSEFIFEQHVVYVSGQGARATARASEQKLQVRFFLGGKNRAVLRENTQDRTR